MGIQINNLSKNYGKKEVLKNLSVEFESGIYGLLGPNGAGKTTLINIMVTTLAATKGQVFWNGIDIRRTDSGYLDVLGYLPQTGAFYKNYTAEEFLRYIAALKDIKGNINGKINELLEFVNLSDERKNKIGSFSGGMKQRLGIAQALLNDPRVLILDEPTAGLDPQERIRLRNLISKISGNKTIIISTHIVPDIEFIANRVILLKNGTAYRNASPKELLDEIDGKVWLIETDEENINLYLGSNKITNILREKDKYFLRIVADDIPSSNAKSISPTLEDVYLYHFGETVS